jgi:site-specific DNA-methyltransferase (adenine-specific)
MSIFSSNFQKNSVHLKDLFFNLNESKTLFVKDKMHETCSYTAMYPAKLAHLLISNFSNIHDKVYDPFSGRGTTLLEARRLNRITYASDLSPLAYVLSRGKCKKISKNTVILRINELSNLYKKAKISFDFDEFKYMRTYFTDEVLKQLYFIRNMIGSQ